MAKGDEFWRMEDGAVVEIINERIYVNNWRNFARNVSQFTRPVSRPQSRPQRSATQWRGRVCQQVASPVENHVSKDLEDLNESLKETSV